VPGVDAQDVLVSCAIRAQEILFPGDAFGEQRLGNQSKFLRGKNMRAKVEVVAFMVDEFEGKHIGRRTEAR
jgi:hypothetical protein